MSTLSGMSVMTSLQMSWSNSGPAASVAQDTCSPSSRALSLHTTKSSRYVVSTSVARVWSSADARAARTENLGKPDAYGSGECLRLHLFRLTCCSRRCPQMGDPEDLAGAIVFLASDASRFMTGAEIRVDGGYCVI